MTTEGIDLHKALFLLLNNHRRKSDERSRPFSIISPSLACVKALQWGGARSRESKYRTCHLLFDWKSAFALLSVINDRRGQPAGSHMRMGSLVRMISSLEAWSRGRQRENDYGLNLWLLSTGLWTVLLLAGWSKFLSLFKASIYSASHCSAGKSFFSLATDAVVWVLYIVCE